MSSQNEAALGSDSLQLSYGLQGGLLAIAIVASVSFVSSTILFLYLGYKLLWHYYTKPRGRISEDRFPSDNAQEAALGIDGIFDGPDHDNHQSHKRRDMSARRWAARDWKPPNQFLVLIFNLLLADMHQALAFLLNVEWLHKRAILVDTPSCFVQGIFISTGDLASSSFITFIAIHAYMSVVQRRLMPRRLLYAMVVCVWAFVYSISLIPIAATLNGARYDGFFVRAGAWVSHFLQDLDEGVRRC